MTTSNVRPELKTRLTSAMRERDRAVASAIRSALAALDNAEAVPVASVAGPADGASEHVATANVGVGSSDAPRRELSAAEEREVVSGEVAELRSAAQELAALGSTDRAKDLRRAAHLIAEALDS